MDWLIVEGVKPYDGRYEFDLAGQEPTTREWGWIKRMSGYMPLTIQQGLEGADPELFSVFAVIALRRAGKIEQTDVQRVFDRLADAPFGATIRLETDSADDETAEGDAGPPEESSSRNNGSSGHSTKTSSDPSATPSPSRSGTPGSDTSVSVPVRWET